jgi:hypothetical protein
MEASVSLGDVGGSGTCGTEYLVTEAIPFFLRQGFAERPSDEDAKNPTSFPAVEVFEGSNGFSHIFLITHN